MAHKVIWLTGSRGFIGRHLVSKLKKKFSEVTCFTNRQMDRSLLVQENNCLYMDYSSSSNFKTQINKLGTPDIFIHLGWGGMTDPESQVHLQENVDEGKTLINTAFECGVNKFLFIGSMNEYGGKKGALAEHMKPEGRLTSYAKGKIKLAEHGFQCAKKLNKTFIHIRPFYVFGPGQRSGSLINDVYYSFKNKKFPELGPCNQYRDYIHVFDVVQGILLTSKLDISTTLNLGSGEYIQVSKFVEMFWDYLGGDKSELKFGSRPMRPGEPEQPKSFADLTHLKELTGWAPEHSLKEGIRLTIEKLKYLS